MKKFLLIFAAIIAFSFSANAESYKINDYDVDAVIDAATEITPDAMSDFSALIPAATPSAASIASSYPSAWGAWAICFFVGGFGIHRHYLGTRPFMWLIYIVTAFGIFGIVPLVDWIVLLVGAIDDDYGKYVGNTKYIMW